MIKNTNPTADSRETNRINAKNRGKSHTLQNTSATLSRFTPHPIQQQHHQAGVETSQEKCAGCGTEDHGDGRSKEQHNQVTDPYPQAILEAAANVQFGLAVVHHTHTFSEK